MPAYHIISAQDFKKTANVTVVDVRNPDEHTAQRLSRPHDLAPLPSLDPDSYMLRHGLDKDAPVYILCKGGVRARTAADKFAARGYTNLYVIEGGIMACEQVGEPLTAADGTVVAAAPAQPVKPDRRLIGAGAAAILGALLSVLSPLFLIVPVLAGGFIVAMALTQKPAPVAAACTSLPKTAGKSAGGCA